MWKRSSNLTTKPCTVFHTARIANSMFSMAFSSVCAATPLYSLGQTKLQLNTKLSSMAFLDLSNCRKNLGCSNSGIFGHGFSFLTSDNSGISVKNRSFATIHATTSTEKSIYDFTVKDVDGKDVSLDKFKGKVLLVVNVASKCGFTSSNYPELAQLYDKYKDQGFEVLAFPCNQFGNQEPGSNQEIKEFASTKFKAEFPIFDKVDVNGPNTAPVYQFLKSSSGGLFGDGIKWNFEKFLVDKKGKVVERYPPTTSPSSIEKDLQKLLAA